MIDADQHSLGSTLTDMMTSLMVIFILLLTNYLSNEQGAVAVARSRTDEMKDLLTLRLKDSLIDGVEVKKIDNYNLVIIVPEDKLQFETGKNKLNDNAILFLQRFTPLLLDSYLSFEQDVSLINVEGHTDRNLRRDASNEYYNWDLSQERASAVMKFIFNSKKDSSEVERFKSIALFGGRGPIECQYDEQVDENLRKTCRTVKFKIRMKSSEENSDEHRRT